jgi:hypothetical protein
MKRAVVAVAVIALSSSIVLFAASRSVLKPSPTAREFVECPLETATTTVTNSLPDPWWTTPQVGRLQDVKIETIGGNRTLMCGYGAYSTTVYVMREFPKGTTNCRPAKNGFWCN